MSEFKPIHCPRWNELPDLELYMDQVISVLNRVLKEITLSNDDKIVTSSMINNYVKHGIVKAPVKKRYERTHLAYLIAVCVLKRVYSMEEISTLISIQMNRYPTDVAYDSFCEEFENCFNAIFSGQAYQPEATDSKYMMLLRSAVQSVVLALFIQTQVIVPKSAKMKEITKK